MDWWALFSSIAIATAIFGGIFYRAYCDYVDLQQAKKDKAVMMQSRQLTEFYGTYRAWVQMGKPATRNFRKDCGLCQNLSNYALDKGYSRHSLLSEMTAQFVAAGMNKEYPFNGTSLSYNEESDATQNDNRMKWVNDHANG